MDRRRQVRRVGTVLLTGLVVLGIVALFIGGATGRWRLFTGGIWLATLGLVLRLLWSLLVPLEPPPE